MASSKKKTATDLYAQVAPLLGKRSDDPAVLAFHKANKMKPPPAVTKLDMMYDVRHEAGYALNYQGEVFLPGYYPPQKEGGKYVAYLSSVTVAPRFEGVVLGELGTKLPEAQAKALIKGAKEASWKTPIFKGYAVKREGEREVVFVYDADDGSLSEVRISLKELDEDDPVIEKLAKEAKGKKGAASARVMPKFSGTPKNEPLPKPLAALAKLQEDDGLGEIDFEMLEQIETGGPKAWTNNAAAEHELRVFAQDGSGGLVAFWLVHDKKPLEEQPIVFLGSEGEVGAVARDLPDFFHLLAQGVGPYEVVEYGTTEGEEPQAAVAKLVTKFFPKRAKRKAEAIILDAQKEFGDITDRVAALNKH